MDYSFLIVSASSYEEMRTVTALSRHAKWTLSDSVVLSLVIWSLTRLRSHAPSARSTCDLVGAVLGDRAATMTALLQLAAYLVLAAELARVIGLDALLMGVEDPAQAVGWLWPL